MLNQKINMLYFLLTCLLFILVATAFFYWNPISFVKNLPSGKPLTTFAIEECSFHKNNIYIKGWAYIPNERNSPILVYAKMVNGHYALIQKIIKTRNDLPNPFHDADFNTIGFLAGKKNIGHNDFTKQIVIIVEGEHKGNYIAQYKCS